MKTEQFLDALRALMDRAHPVYHAYRIKQIRDAIDALPSMDIEDWQKHYGGECIAAVRSIDQDLRVLDGRELWDAAKALADELEMEARAAEAWAA